MIILKENITFAKYLPKEIINNSKQLIKKVFKEALPTAPKTVEIRLERFPKISKSDWLLKVFVIW